MKDKEASNIIRKHKKRALKKVVYHLTDPEEYLKQLYFSEPIIIKETKGKTNSIIDGG